MKLIGIATVYGAILFGSWELQKFDLLLGYTLGLVGLIAATVLFSYYIARKVI